MTQTDVLETPARRPRRHSVAREVAVLVAVGGAVALLLRLFVAQAYVIPSGSMQPLLQPADRVLVTTLGQASDDIRRGDVVVFDGTGLFAAPPPADRPVWDSVAGAVRGWLGARGHDYVKRVVGLPGERVACCDARGRVTVDGMPLDEPYVLAGDAPSDLRFDVVVPQGRVWLMGDHRSDSADSRAHLGDPGGGMVPMSRVVGRVVAVVWPVGRWAGVDRLDAHGGVR